MNPTSQSKTRYIFLYILFSSLFFMPILAISALSQDGGDPCTVTSWSVANESELNGAIQCINDQTTATTYTISFTQSISLTASTLPITNTTTNLSVEILGNDFALNGQNGVGTRPLHTYPETNVTLQNLTITDGNHADMGGGIFNEGNLTLNQTIVQNNTSIEGGGIANYGTLILNESTIDQNSATYGAGIANLGSLTTNDSTLSHNSAAMVGGGIINGDTVVLNNSTLSSNSANFGGGIANDAGLVTLNSSTVAFNTAVFQGGGIDNFDGLVALNNSIISNSTTGSNCFGTFISNNFNLDSDGSCNLNHSNDISNQDPFLGPLSQNGGATATHPLYPGSPAHDSGNSTLTFDQLGTSRPQGIADDRGAFEYAGPVFRQFIPIIQQN